MTYNHLALASRFAAEVRILDEIVADLPQAGAEMVADVAASLRVLLDELISEYQPPVRSGQDWLRSLSGHTVDR